MNELNTEEIKHIRDLALADSLNGNDKNINGSVLRKLDEQLLIHSVVVPKGTLCVYCKKPMENTCCNDCLEEMDSHNH